MHVTQLEKLLQKNYFLHQSAKDGFRAYLQSYASYSLKKIFDVNALDLAKVGKAFGFSVPPRVNVNIGGGKSVTSGIRKRSRDEDHLEEGGDVETDGPLDNVVESEDRGRGHGKQRRIETLGKKKVDKEVYKKGKERQKMAATGQWSS